MKKLLLIVVVAALALTLVPLAIAGAQGGGGCKNGHAKFNLVGKVTALAPVVEPAVNPAVDAAAEPSPVESPVLWTLTIQVKAGSHIKGIKGENTPFTVPADLKVWQLTEDGKVESSLDKLEANDWVKVKGTIKVVDGSKVYTITSIKYRDLTPDEETPSVEPTTPPVAR